MFVIEERDPMSIPENNPEEFARYLLEQGEPLPVDLYMDLQSRGIDPEALMDEYDL